MVFPPTPSRCSGIPPLVSAQCRCEHIRGASLLQLWANAQLAETMVMPAKASIAPDGAEWTAPSQPSAKRGQRRGKSDGSGTAISVRRGSSGAVQRSRARKACARRCEEPAPAPRSTSRMTNSETVIEARAAPRCGASLGRRQSAAKPEQSAGAPARRRELPQRRPLKRVWHCPAAQQASVADSSAPTAFRVQS